MVAKTAGSSSASADSLIGKLISLTSKSEIRYEGNLHDISSENSTISLRNVRSFGTEGRRKDGPQIAPDDRIYEYILFRESKIKDLQVIPSPLVQTTASIYDDPAIVIQSHNPQATTSLVSMPVGPRFIPNHSGPTQYPGHHWPTFQGNVPLHQSAGSLGSWVTPSPLSTDISGLGTSISWPGFHGYQNCFQPYQQSMPQHPFGLPIPSMQSMMQYLLLNGLLTGNSGHQPSQLLASSSLSLASNKCDIMNFHSTMPPAPPSALVPEPSPILVPAMSSVQSLTTAKLGTTASLLLESPLTNDSILELSIPLSVSDESKLASTSYIASSSTSESLSLAIESSSVLANDPLSRSLVTPNQLFQPELSSASPLMALPNPPSTMVNEISSLDSQSPLFAAQEPLLPLLPDSKLLKASSSTHHNSSRGGRRRERKIRTSNTEEFDFMAMNEKFNKDEIWSALNSRNRNISLEDKNTTTSNTEEFVFMAMNEKFNEDEIWGALNSLNRNISVEDKNTTVQPSYVKDDFFDSLSNRNSKVSEHQKKDNDTFDKPARHKAGRGVGPTGGSQSRVEYLGRSREFRGKGQGQGSG